MRKQRMIRASNRVSSFEDTSDATDSQQLPWVLGAGIVMTISLGLASEIVQRLWGSELDSVSILGIVIPLFLAGSPLLKSSRQLADWIFHRFAPSTPLKDKTFFAAALLAFLILLLIRLSLPMLATLFNNRGTQQLQAGNLADAQRAFTRAVKLNPAYAIAYYNLAQEYAWIGAYDKSVEFHQRALEIDESLDLAYSGMGYALIAQGKPEQAIAVLYAGLSHFINPSRSNPCLDATNQNCIALWTNLGRAYLRTGRYREAEDALIQALALNPQEAPALCDLALTAEALSHSSTEITQYWESCLRYVQSVPIPARKLELETLARTHLQQWEEIAK